MEIKGVASKGVPAQHHSTGPARQTENHGVLESEWDSGSPGSNPGNRIAHGCPRLSVSVNSRAGGDAAWDEGYSMLGLEIARGNHTPPRCTPPHLISPHLTPPHLTPPHPTPPHPIPPHTSSGRAHPTRHPSPKVQSCEGQPHHCHTQCTGWISGDMAPVRKPLGW